MSLSVEHKRQGAGVVAEHKAPRAEKSYQLATEIPVPEINELPVQSPSSAPEETAEQAPAGGASTEETILEVVAEKTGYPASMLSFDMDLERDLGIDSIKKVEILSLLGEKIPEIKLLQSHDLAQFKKLSELLDMLSANRKISDVVPGAELTLERSGASTLPEQGTISPLWSRIYRLWLAWRLSKSMLRMDMSLEVILE